MFTLKLKKGSLTLDFVNNCYSAMGDEAKELVDLARENYPALPISTAIKKTLYDCELIFDCSRCHATFDIKKLDSEGHCPECAEAVEKDRESLIKTFEHLEKTRYL